ncbi:MAG TPA: hypothetical protein VHW47_09880 [Acidimicrobiales bacterium]|nr:hypothetical protein [Acidimicrobiales bacterium]
MADDVDGAEDLGGLVGGDEVAAILEVSASRLQAMVEEGLLTPVPDGADGGPWFRRAEVLAVREIGG